MDLFEIVKDNLSNLDIVEELEKWLDSDTLREFAISLIYDYDLDQEIREKAHDIINDMSVSDLVDFIDNNE